ncbi:MAG: hypothetical protein ABI693_03245 [Bryobacteraceae bacterium]
MIQDKASDTVPKGVSLTISIDQSVPIKANGKVLVKLRLENKSNKVLRMWDRFVERDFELRVVAPYGTEAPLTDFGKSIRTPPFRNYRNMLITVAPGQIVRDEQELTRVYVVKEQGWYSVQACRDLIDFGNLYSNRIELEVK